MATSLLENTPLQETKNIEFMQQLDTEPYKNGIKTRKVKKKKCHQFLTQCIYDFAENTTLNGLKYIADGSTYIERLFWVSTFILSAVLCFFMVYKTYVKWDNDAVIITLKEHLVPVDETPFPAVTICPLVRIKRDYYDLKDAYSSHKKGEAFQGRNNILYNTALILCQKSITTNFNNYKYPETFLRESHKMAPHYKDVFESCKFRGEDCINNFRKVLTADGVCFTFNSLAAKDIFKKNTVQYEFHQYHLDTNLRQRNWDLDTNTYNSTFFSSVYPRRGRANGLMEDLTITLQEIKDRDSVCDTHSRSGYKVYLHHPADLPQASLHYYMASQEHTTSIALKLDILGTSGDIVKYHPDVRQCYFPSEKKLHYFKQYTQKNCQLECLTKYTLRMCKCVNFYMPRYKAAICNSTRLDCTSIALNRYVSYKINAEKCGCLPSCNDIKYNADIIVTKFDQREYNEMLEELKYIENGEDDEGSDDDNNDDDDDDNDDDDDYDDDYDDKHDNFSHDNNDNMSNNNELNVTVNYNDTNNDIYENNDDDTDSSDDSDVDSDESSNDSSDDDSNDNSVEDNRKTEIRIYYRQPEFVAMERSELFGLSQFLADCGGTLGLFLGFSFLTIAEIFYFFTLKLFCRLRTEKKAEEKEDKTREEI